MTRLNYLRNDHLDWQINIDGHDYEYPSAPGQKRNIEPAADAYQELQPQSKQKTPPPKYQTLSADEELGTKVTVGPEDSAGFSSVTSC